MFKEILLASTILSNYARAVYAPFSAASYQGGEDNGILLSSVTSRADSKIEQISAGNVGTISSEGIQTAMMLQSIDNAATQAATCSASPIYFNTVGSFTWTNTLSSACGHMVLRAWGGGGCNAGLGGGRGGGFGQQNGVALTPGQVVKGQVGDGSWSAVCNGYHFDVGASFVCATTTNCGSYTASGVLAMGTSGLQTGLSNKGGTTFNGGSVGHYAFATGGGYNGGGGGGGAGPDGAGGNGTNATTSKGGTGGTGDNGSGGAGGTGGNSGSIGAPGTNGVSLGGTGLQSGGGGGGGSSHSGNHNAGAGGQVGAGVGGVTYSTYPDGGKGQIAIIPGP